MPSEKAKENKALAATCVACQKSFSPEVMVTLPGLVNGRRKPFPVCVTCAQSGWRPPHFDGIFSYRPQ
jgi:uncharacterized protein with PIN domain